MMTLEQFQATRKWSDDVSKTTGYDYGEGLSGFVYAQGLHILAMGGGAAPDEYQLLIMGEEKVSPNLEELERDLYQFGVEDGAFPSTSK
jgi:hypothetical protein